MRVVRKGDIRITNKTAASKISGYDWAIRIGDPGSDFQGNPGRQNYIFTFDDAIAPGDYVVAPAANVMHGMTQVIGRILEEKRQPLHRDGRILIHCSGGTCRSTAVGIYLLLQDGWNTRTPSTMFSN